MRRALMVILMTLSLLVVTVSSVSADVDGCIVGCTGQG
jgi:hypothetical protein